MAEVLRAQIVADGVKSRGHHDGRPDQVHKEGDTLALSQGTVFEPPYRVSDKGFIEFGRTSLVSPHGNSGASVEFALKSTYEQIYGGSEQGFVFGANPVVSKNLAGINGNSNDRWHARTPERNPYRVNFEMYKTEQRPYVTVEYLGQPDREVLDGVLKKQATNFEAYRTVTHPTNPNLVLVSPHRTFDTKVFGFAGEPLSERLFQRHGAYDALLDSSSISYDGERVEDAFPCAANFLLRLEFDEDHKQLRAVDLVLTTIGQEDGISRSDRAGVYVNRRPETQEELFLRLGRVSAFFKGIAEGKINGFKEGTLPLAVLDAMGYYLDEAGQTGKDQRDYRSFKNADEVLLDDYGVSLSQALNEFPSNVVLNEAAQIATTVEKVSA